jgi:RNA polymerase sigma-70 factor (ECF subfamily)
MLPRLEDVKPMGRAMNVDPTFLDLYEREFPRVFRATWRLGGDRELAHDATQEAFVRALERWDRLEGRPWAGGWVMSVALNVVRRGLRKRRAPEARPSDVPDASEIVAMWDAVAALPLRQRQAVVLYYGVDLPVEEVAKAMGCREGTARAHLARAREALHRALGSEIDAAR